MCMQNKSIYTESLPEMAIKGQTVFYLHSLLHFVDSYLLTFSICVYDYFDPC